MNNQIQEIFLKNFNPSSKHVKYARVASQDKTAEIKKIDKKK